LSRRRLDHDERVVLFTIFGVALLTRLIAILGLFALGIPEHSDRPGSLTAISYNAAGRCGRATSARFRRPHALRLSSPPIYTGARATSAC
jgi:hypothetical protein